MCNSDQIDARNEVLTAKLLEVAATNATLDDKMAELQKQLTKVRDGGWTHGHRGLQSSCSVMYLTATVLHC